MGYTKEMHCPTLKLKIPRGRALDKAKRDRERQLHASLKVRIFSPSKAQLFI